MSNFKDEKDEKELLIEKVKKNPKEIAAVVRTETFMISNELSSANMENGDYPLSIYSSFSRFPIAIINEQKKAATANIRIEDMFQIIKKSKIISRMDYENSLKDDDSELPSCYTTLITSGKLKGRTPVDALLNVPDGATLLKNQYKWLADNVKRYPKNKILMDAIAEAAKLKEEGKLNADLNKTSLSATIWEVGMRPLTRRKREDGKCLVYEASIKYLGTEHPIEITIVNYFAPVIKKDDGTLNVLASQAADRRVNKMSLSMAEWDNIIHLIETNIQLFELSEGPKLTKTATQIAIENYKKAIETKEIA